MSTAVTTAVNARNTAPLIKACLDVHDIVAPETLIPAVKLGCRDEPSPRFVLL